MSYKTQDGLSEEDIKRIINNEVLEKWLKDKVKEVYKEEKEREIKEIQKLILLLLKYKQFFHLIACYKSYKKQLIQMNNKINQLIKIDIKH